MFTKTDAKLKKTYNKCWKNEPLKMAITYFFLFGIGLEADCKQTLNLKGRPATVQQQYWIKNCSGSRNITKYES